jgi:fructose-specific phosphotransferase system component IIB
VLLVGGETSEAEKRFEGVKTIIASLGDVLADAGDVLARASLRATQAATAGHKKIVAITSCPTGIAHTFMAAEGLQQAGAALGHDIRVETQGSVGAQTPLTAAEIAADQQHEGSPSNLFGSERIQHAFISPDFDVDRFAGVLCGPPQGLGRQYAGDGNVAGRY